MRPKNLHPHVTPRRLHGWPLAAVLAATTTAAWAALAAGPILWWLNR